LAAHKLCFFLFRGIEHQFQIGRVHVGIGQDDGQFLECQVGQRRRDRRLARSPFAAEYN
jgi:hypothetical protein